MILIKYKLGDLISRSELKNKDEKYNSSNVKGISINKEMCQYGID